MAIVTVSRGSYSKGKEVAEGVAAKLGYDCIGREVLIRASEEFNISEIKLARALHDAPTVFEKLTYGKERYVAYFQAAFLRRILKDNVVYHGLAGHFFLKGIAHALKVRIISDVADRVKVEMERKGISADDAVGLLQKEDEARRQWSRALYGIDTWDPGLYDVVLHIRKITVADAVDTICQLARLDTFKTTPESRMALEDLALAAEVKVSLIPLKPDIDVYAKNGNVYIGTRSSLVQNPELVGELETVAKRIPGVGKVEVKISHLVNWSD